MCVVQSLEKEEKEMNITNSKCWKFKKKELEDFKREKSSIEKILWKREISERKRDIAKRCRV